MTLQISKETVFIQIQNDLQVALRSFFEGVALRLVKHINANRDKWVDDVRSRSLLEGVVKVAQTGELMWPQQWLDALNEAVDGFVSAKQDAKKNDSFLNTLQLVSVEEMELQLAISKAAKAPTEKANKSLNELIGRLAVLWGDHDDPNNPLPYRPDRLITILMKPFSELDPDMAAQALKLLNLEVLGDFSDLYGQLNQALDAAGVTLAPSSVLPRPQRAEKAAGNSVFGEQATELGRAHSNFINQANGQAQTNFTNTAEATLFDKLERFLNSQPASVNQAYPMQSAMMQPMPISPEFLQWMAQLQSAQSAQVRQPLVSANAIPVDPVYWQLLTELQKSPPLHLPGAIQTPQGIAPSADTLTALLAHLPVLPPAERRVTELVQNIFGSVTNNPDLPENVKELVEHLRLPVLRSALLDKSFFVQEDNSTRQFLSAIVKLAENLPSKIAQDDPLLVKASDLVSRVNQNFEQDPNIFHQLLSDLNQYQEQEADQRVSQLDQIVQSELHEEQTEFSLDNARSYLDGQLQSIPVPDFLRTFLYDVWAGFLAKVEHDDGAQSERLQGLHKQTEDLVWSITPKQDAEGRKALLERSPQIVKQLSATMKSFSVSNEIRVSFIRGFNDFLMALLKSRIALQQIETGRSAPVLRVRRNKMIEDEFTEQIKSLSVGIWFIFTDKEGVENELLLSWISPMGTKYLFSNRQGHNSFSMSPQELASELRMSRARQSNTAKFSENIIEQAVEAVISSVN